MHYESRFKTFKPDTEADIYEINGKSVNDKINNYEKLKSKSSQNKYSHFNNIDKIGSNRQDKGIYNDKNLDTNKISELYASDEIEVIKYLFA